MGFQLSDEAICKLAELGLCLDFHILSFGAVTNKYVRGINLLSFENGNGADKRYFLYNGHGDTVHLTSTTGSSIKTYDYDAFGNEKNADPNDTNLFKYCGEYFDTETGTIYLRARYYDPTIGRFITEDSYWGKDSDPLSLNLYTYCENDPVNYFDPSGHWTLSQYDNLGSGMYARLKEEGISILQLNPVSMLMNSYKQWKALLNNDITVAEVYATGFESIISDYKYVLDGENNFIKAYMPLNGGASDKEVYNAGYHIAGIIIDLSTAGVAVDDVVKAVRANRAAIKIAESSQKGKLKLDYQRFAKKDLKMVNDAAREVGVDRNAFGEYIHELKSDLGMKASQNFTYKELKEYAKQLKKYMDK